MTSEPWLKSITSQLNLRDHRDKHPYIPLSKSYLEILNDNVELSSRVSNLEKAVLQYKNESWRNNSNDTSSLSINNSNINDNEINIKLKNENESLKKELFEVFRLKKEDEQALSRLKKQAIEHEELILSKGKNLDEFSTKYQELSNKYENISELNEKLKGNLEVLNAESVALRKAHDNGLNQLEKYKDENRRLTEQLIKLKENQMDSLNEWQTEYEKFRKLNKQTIEKNRIRAQSDLNMHYNNDDYFNTNKNNNNNIKPKLPQYTAPTKKSISNSNSNSPPNNPKLNKNSKSWSLGHVFKNSVFGNIIKDNNKNNNDNIKNNEKKNEDDFFVSKGPIVDLYGPSLFNISPPKLKINSWQAHGEEVSRIIFDGSGKKIISGGNDKIIKIWDSGSGNELGSLRGSNGSIIDLIQSPNRQYIASGGNDCKIRLFNLKTQRQLRVYNGHTNKITSICMSSDSKKLFSGSHDRTIKIWDIESAACRYTISAHSGVNFLTISPDEYYLGSAHLDGQIRFWSWRDRKELFSLKDHGKSQTNGIVFRPPDGYNIITSSKDGRIILWDLRKQRKLNEIINKNFKNTTMTGNPIFSPDGKYILAGSSIKDNKLNKYPIFIWNTDELKFKYCLNEHKYSITNLVWDNRGGVASCDRGGNIITWC